MRSHSLLLLLVAGALPAQYVSPAHFAAAEGTSNNVFPFGNTTVPFRYCQVHDDVPTMAISGIAFRHNLAAAVYPAHTVTINAWVSTAVTTSATIDATFDNNHGLDKTQVITNRTYSLPASNPNAIPGPFILDYAFDFPFVFAGAPASLCWEVQVVAKTQTSSIIYDATSSVATGANPTGTNPVLQQIRMTNGCRATGQTAAMLATPTAAVSWPTASGTLTVTGTNLLANGAVFFCLGLQNQLWVAGATPLPAVIPTSTGAPSGTCSLFTDIAVATFMTATAAGGAALTFGVAPDPSYHGLTVFSQILGLDPAANPYGITSSGLAVQHFVEPYPVQPASRVFLSASLGATGTAAVGYSLVTKFY